MSAADAANSRALIWIDGASRGNPGEAGFGVVSRQGDENQEVGGYLGRATNNVAEYAGLIAALSLAKRRGVKRLTIHSDSQLLVRQVEGTYRVKARHLIPIFSRVLELRQSFDDLGLEHVPREENLDADRIANLAIDERMSLPDWLELELPVE